MIFPTLFFYLGLDYYLEIKSQGCFSHLEIKSQGCAHGERVEIMLFYSKTNLRSKKEGTILLHIPELS